MLTEGIVILILAAVGYDKAKKENVDKKIINMHIGNIVMGIILVLTGSFTLSRFNYDPDRNLRYGVCGAVVLILSAIGFDKAKKDGITGNAKNMHLGNMIMGALMVATSFFSDKIANKVSSYYYKNFK
jgi:multisubunit Na+/H+ antiporter MnhB subunit